MSPMLPDFRQKIELDLVYLKPVDPVDAKEDDPFCREDGEFPVPPLDSPDSRVQGEGDPSLPDGSDSS